MSKLKFTLCLLGIFFLHHELLAWRIVSFAACDDCGGTLATADDGSSMCYMPLGIHPGMHPGVGTVSIPLKVTSELSKDVVLKQPNWTLVQIDLPRGARITSKDIDAATKAVVKYYNSKQKDVKMHIAVSLNMRGSTETGQVSKTSREGETVWVAQGK